MKASSKIGTGLC